MNPILSLCSFPTQQSEMGYLSSAPMPTDYIRRETSPAKPSNFTPWEYAIKRRASHCASARLLTQGDEYSGGMGQCLRLTSAPETEKASCRNRAWLSDKRKGEMRWRPMWGFWPFPLLSFRPWRDLMTLLSWVWWTIPDSFQYILNPLLFLFALNPIV